MNVLTKERSAWGGSSGDGLVGAGSTDTPFVPTPTEALFMTMHAVSGAESDLAGFFSSTQIQVAKAALSLLCNRVPLPGASNGVESSGAAALSHLPTGFQGITKQEQADALRALEPERAAVQYRLEAEVLIDDMDNDVAVPLVPVSVADVARAGLNLELQRAEQAHDLSTQIAVDGAVRWLIEHTQGSIA